MFCGTIYKQDGKARIKSEDGQDYLIRFESGNIENFVGKRVLCEGTILNSVDIGLNFWAVFISIQ